MNLLSKLRKMAKMLLLTCTHLLIFFILTSPSASTVYTVGDNSGWDISTDLDSWAKDKTFSVGDTLLFQYSQYHSVSEVSKEKYEGCSTTNVLESSSNGNTTIALTKPGDRFFVCGNRLHCLGGMKLRANVVANDSGAASPTTAPLSRPQPGGALPPGSSKSNNPTSSSFLIRVTSFQTLALVFLCFLILLYPDI